MTNTSPRRTLEGEREREKDGEGDGRTIVEKQKRCVKRWERKRNADKNARCVLSMMDVEFYSLFFCVHILFNEHKAFSLLCMQCRVV